MLAVVCIWCGEKFLIDSLAVYRADKIAESADIEHGAFYLCAECKFLAQIRSGKSIVTFAQKVSRYPFCLPFSAHLACAEYGFSLGYVTVTVCYRNLAAVA